MIISTLWLTIIALCVIGIGTACRHVDWLQSFTNFDDNNVDQYWSLIPKMTQTPYIPGVIAGLISSTMSFG